MEPAVTIQRAPRRRSTHGLTLVETLIAVAVLGVILAVAAPSLRDLLSLPPPRCLAASALA